MKSGFFYLGCFCALLLELGVVRPVRAQQNFFNSPIGEITPRNRFFFQNQATFYGGNSMESRSTFVYGLGDGYDVGISLTNLKPNLRHKTEALLFDRREYNPTGASLFQLTGQKEYVVSARLRTVIGTRLGVLSSYFDSKAGLTHFSYKVWVYKPRADVSLVAGLYLTDRRTVGPGSNFGLLIGLKYPLTEKLLLVGDFTSGTHAASGTVLGFTWLAGKRVQTNLGAVLPNPASGNRPGLAVGLNLVGFDRKPASRFPRASFNR